MHGKTHAHDSQRVHTVIIYDDAVHVSYIHIYVYVYIDAHIYIYIYIKYIHIDTHTPHVIYVS